MNLNLQKSRDSDSGVIERRDSSSSLGRWKARKEAQVLEHEWRLDKRAERAESAPFVKGCRMKRGSGASTK